MNESTTSLQPPAVALHSGTPPALESYEQKLRHARFIAYWVGSCYNLSRFLALCSLTWATVVLLGAFVSDLHFADYAMVTTLLILEAIRLASAAFFTILLTHGISRGSQNPQYIINDCDDRYHHAFIARIVSTVLQALLIFPTFVIFIIRIHIIHYTPFHNLHISISIFYVLALINASLSSITVASSSAAFIYLRDRHDQSLLRYYDEIVQNAISTGVIQADEFGFFHFAYKMLGGEYARILKPEEVVKNHHKLVAYLYYHRVGQDFLLVYLDAHDAYVRQAALNMAGFWGDVDPAKNLGIKKLRIAEEVLTKMADNVAQGHVGWAAINSFLGLARRDAGYMAKAQTSSGMPLLDRLAELVIKTARSGALPYVRAIALFYHYSYEQEEERQREKRPAQKEALDLPVLRQKKELEETLKALLQGARVQRVRVYAAYLLHLIGGFDAPCCGPLVEAIRPSQDTYWFAMEQSMLGFLINKYTLRLPSSSWPLPPKLVHSNY